VRGLQASAKKHERETTAEAALGQEFKHCIGPLASVHALFEAGSDDFHRETRTSAEALPSTEYASSNVEVVRTPSVAAAEAATARSEHVRSCLSRLFGALLSTRVRKEGASVSSLTVSSLTPAAPGASGSYGWKTDITVSAHGIAFATRIDILGFAYGPGLVTLADAGAPQPFPPAREQQLFSVLIGRAEGFSA
jgi:hypothetical protein